MERRYILAFTLSLLILIGYPYLITRIYGPQGQENAEIEPYEEYEEEVTKARFIPVTPSIPPPTLASQVVEEAIKHPLFLETETLELFLHPRNGSIQQIFLKEYLDDEDQPLELINVEESSNFVTNVWFESPKIFHIPMEKVEQHAQFVRFKGVLIEGVTFEKQLELISNYTLKLSLIIRNRSAQTLPVYYHLVAASGLRAGSKEEERFFEALSFSNGKQRKFSLGKVRKNPVSSEVKPEWVALKAKYFSLLFRPETGTELSGYTLVSTEEEKSMAFRVSSMPQNIPPGGSVTEEYIYYFGPNKLQELQKLGSWAEGFMHSGWFGGITRLILWALTHIYLVVRNYGVAIIILTILVSIVFFPLTRVSYNSMKRMKLLQPEVNKLRQVYKDKPQKMNKEMMALYKRNKVNPLGGCLPMLIQMPIFIAFYQALMGSIELKGASFLFIKDLSMPDRAIPLPFSLGPLGNAINVLPLLMMLAMYIQQKIASPEASPGKEGDTQRMMTNIMPFMFGFIFYRLPSGLVLYWLTNNILMIVTQKFFIKGPVALKQDTR